MIDMERIMTMTMIGMNKLNSMLSTKEKALICGIAVVVLVVLALVMEKHDKKDDDK